MNKKHELRNNKNVNNYECLLKRILYCAGNGQELLSALGVTLSSRTNLDIDDITTLLQFTLSNNYFVFNDIIYKQAHGCAMGSPVSPVVASLCMEEIEESAISNSSVPPKIWKRHVDDSFCIIGKNDVSSFHDTLNSIGTNTSFTIETECNGKIAFLDTLVSRRNGATVVDIYRKPTHTDRYLDYRQKASTASTLLHRALSLPNSSEGKKRELNYVHAALESKGYPSKFIKIIHVKRTRSSTTNVSPEELVGMFFKMVEPTESRKSFASLPYIKGVTEPLTRVLKKTRCQSCKQTIYHPTTTVPSSEISTFDGIADREFADVQNSLYKLFVVLHWGNRQSF